MASLITGDQHLRSPLSGTKNDSNKLRFDLVPAIINKGLASVFTHGCIKYAERNWELGIKYSRVYAATRRHLEDWWGGEDHDKDSGLLHLWHAMWGCGALAFYTVLGSKYKMFDDRPSHGGEDVT